MLQKVNKQATVKQYPISTVCHLKQEWNNFIYLHIQV